MQSAPLSLKPAPRTGATSISTFTRLFAANRQAWLLALILVLAVLAAYQPALYGGFIWDDDSMLTNNPLIKAANGLWRIWFTREPLDYFPLTLTSLWLEWRLWGLHPFGYHLTNILLHAGSALLLWRVLKRLQIPAPWFAAAVFALHPVNVESVAWIAERKNTLSMFFFLLSILGYLRSDQCCIAPSAARRPVRPPAARALSRPRLPWARPPQLYYWLSLGAFLLALLSKTAVVMLPLVLLACVRWLRPISARDALRLLPLALLSLVFGLVTVWFQYHNVIGSQSVNLQSLPARFAAAGWYVWFYLFKALVPIHLNFVYPRWQVDPMAWTAWLPDAVLLACFLWFRSSKRGLPFLFALTCFLLLLLPVLGFFNVYFQKYSLVADHWQYFSIISVIALVVAGAHRLLCVRSTTRLSRLAPSTVALALLAILALQSHARARIFQTNESLWRDTVFKSPGSSMAHNNLAASLLSAGKVEEAMQQVRVALDLNPRNWEALDNLGSLLLAQGKLDQAASTYEAVLEIEPASVSGHLHLAGVLFQQGKAPAALDHYSMALRLDPRNSTAHFALGGVLEQMGRTQEALSQYEAALRLNPDSAEAHCNLASALVKLRSFQPALAHSLAAIRLEPSLAEAHYNAANALALAGNPRDAIPYFEQAIRLRPQWVAARFNLGVALATLGERVVAERCLSEVVRLSPTDPDPHNLLAALFRQDGDTPAAIKEYREALRLQPDSVRTLTAFAWLLATHPDPGFRDGAHALELSQHAVQLTGGRDARALDTLAAALAETGRFAEAAQTCSNALALATAGNDAALTPQLEQRLRLYQNAQPLRE